MDAMIYRAKVWFQQLNTRQRVIGLIGVLAVLHLVLVQSGLMFGSAENEVPPPVLRKRNEQDNFSSDENVKRVREFAQDELVTIQSWGVNEQGPRRNNVLEQELGLRDALTQAKAEGQRRLDNPRGKNGQGLKGTTAIIIPYRNRGINWLLFRSHMAPLLSMMGSTCNWGFEVFLVEQVDGKSFNRGGLFNAGLDYIDRHYSGDFAFDCVVVHDVDMLPAPGVDYTRCDKVYQMSASQQTEHWGFPYSNYFGGVVMLSLASWKAADGMAREFWGWGFEDDELRFRLKYAGLLNGPMDKPHAKESLAKNRLPMSRYYMIHDNSVDHRGSRENAEEYGELTKTERAPMPGLAGLRYSVASVVKDDYEMASMGQIFVLRTTLLQVYL